MRFILSNAYFLVIKTIKLNLFRPCREKMHIYPCYMYIMLPFFLSKNLRATFVSFHAK